MTLLRLIGRKEKKPLATRLPSDVRARGEHGDRRQPAAHLIDVLELADPIDRADEDVLQEIRNLRVAAQHGLEGPVNRGGVTVIEDSGGAGMSGTQRVYQIVVSAGKGQWRHHLFYRLAASPAAIRSVHKESNPAQYFG